MTSDRCARLWEVEAARNGQLADQALPAHQRHVVNCNECAAQQGYFESLGRALQEPDEPLDELAMRHARQRLMQRAASRLRAPEARRFGVRGAALAMTVAIVVIGAGDLAIRGAWRSATPTHHPVTVTQTGTGSLWSRHTASDVEHINLREGQLRFVVQRRSGDRRVIVHVPDGEIEDLGTTFDVTVQAGRTSEIAVHKGVVVFRPRGGQSLRLTAGTVWRASALPAMPDAAAQAQRSAPAATIEPTAQSPLRAAPPHVTTRVTTRSSPHTPVVPSVPQPASTSDTLAEDVAYLQVVALLREGRDAEARLAAAAYLRSFPGGFRRQELQRIAAHRRQAATLP